MTDKIDLHTHSTASDGTLTPSELAKAARIAKLRAIALTDHDTTDGVCEFLKECGMLGIEGIAGVEISAEYDKEMHILGLFINPDDADLKEKLGHLKSARETRNRKMLERIRENGMDISEEDVIPKGADMRSIGRAHFARAMVNKGYVKDTNEAFVKYLKRGNPCYVKRITYSPEESIRLIKNAGGIAVLAHPVYITEDRGELRSLLSTLREYGLDGAECFYNSYSAAFSKMCCEICDSLGLLKSGGSDFHGANKPDIALGKVSTGHVPYELLVKIKTQRSLS